MNFTIPAELKWQSIFAKNSRKASHDKQQHTVVNNKGTTRSTTPHYDTARPSPVTNSSITKDYRLLPGALAHGTTSTVHLASRKSNNKIYAVKTFTKLANVHSQKHQTQSIITEYWIGSLLSQHTNIITNIELFQDSQRWYHVMEYAPGNLFDRVTSGLMTPREIDCSFAQICSAVAHIHRMGFAHRDLKLENVAYLNDGCVKVIDFGTAAHIGDDLNARVPTVDVGSLQYQAPELFGEAMYSPVKADVWSLGVMYASMCLGRFPWKMARVEDSRFGDYVNRTTQRRSPSVSVNAPPPGITKGADTHEMTMSSGLPNFFDGFPISTRPVLKRILQIDPSLRPHMSHVLLDPHVSNIEVCVGRTSGHGSASSHSHI